MKKYTLNEVKLENGFFNDLQALNETTTIYAVYNQFKNTGRFEAIKLKKIEGAHIFWDSDVAKWLESAIYIMNRNNDPKLKEIYEETVNILISNQREDGYFNSYFMVFEPEKIFTDRTQHELYCAGHLFEAAHAAKMYLADDRLLNFSKKYCLYIKKRFIEEKNTSFITPGHEEIELALYKLFDITGDPLYKELFDFFMEQRGKQNEQAYEFADAKYSQSHKTIFEQTTAHGHAVRALYFYSAMSDYAYLHNDDIVRSNCEALFNDIVNCKMYVTGGIGQSYVEESITVPYDLPNDKSYSETCASIAMVLFAQRQIANNRKYSASYGDIIEKSIYNSVISGLSMDGKCFFYTNPLEINYKKIKHFENKKWKEGQPLLKRVEYFGCSCCPPNVTRLIEQIPTLIYYSDENNIYIDQLISSKLDDKDNCIEMQSKLPFDGKVKIKINKTSCFNIVIRIPTWCMDFEIDNDFENIGNSIVINIENVKEINLKLDIPLHTINCDPKSVSNSGKECFSYGPFVLCAEQCDNPDLNLFGVKVLPNILKKEFTNGFFKLTFDAIQKVNPSNSLYYYDDNKELKTKIVLKPYYQWANDEDGDMVVWFTK